MKVPTKNWFIVFERFCILGLMVKVFCALLVKLSDSDSRKALTEGLFRVRNLLEEY